jgi:hypothetical protein
MAGTSAPQPGSINIQRQQLSSVNTLVWLIFIRRPCTPQIKSSIIYHLVRKVQFPPKLTRLIPENPAPTITTSLYRVSIALVAVLDLLIYSKIFI